MSEKLIKIGIGVLTLLIGIFIIVGIAVTASNKEISLRSKIIGQKQVCEASYDKMWKIIQQEAEVSDQYKEAFKEIYPALIEGRYGNEKGGTLMKWITESNPTFDVSLYQKLMNSIEAERTNFFMEQKKLIDLSNEHRIIRNTFPNSIFIGSRPDVEIVIVSSNKTKEVMSSGIDNDVNVFKK